MYDVILKVAQRSEESQSLVLITDASRSLSLSEVEGLSMTSVTMEKFSRMH